MQGFKRFNQGVLAMPVPWQLWVILLVGLNLVAPLFFLEHLQARVVLAVGLVGIGLMSALTSRFGFSRIVGLGHIGWLPLLGFLWTQLPELPASDAFGVWLRAVVVADATSLVIDAVDAIRFARGERDETVPTFAPAPGH